MDVVVETYLSSNFITALEIRWLVVEYAFSYIYITNVRKNYLNGSDSYNNNNPSYVLVPLGISVSDSDDKMMKIINGLDF